MTPRKGKSTKQEVEHCPLDRWAADILRLLSIFHVQLSSFLLSSHTAGTGIAFFLKGHRVPSKMGLWSCLGLL